MSQSTVDVLMYAAVYAFFLGVGVAVRWIDRALDGKPFFPRRDERP